MAVAGHDAGGELDETLAAQERRKRPAGVGAVFVTSVTLPIVKRGGSRELTVKVTSSNSSGLPFRTVLAFTSPSSIRDGWNTFTVASGEDPVLDTNTDYFIVVAQSGGCRSSKPRRPPNSWHFSPPGEVISENGV